MRVLEMLSRVFTPIFDLHNDQLLLELIGESPTKSNDPKEIERISQRIEFNYDRSRARYDSHYREQWLHGLMELSNRGLLSSEWNEVLANLQKDSLYRVLGLFENT